MQGCVDIKWFGKVVVCGSQELRVLAICSQLLRQKIPMIWPSNMSVLAAHSPE